MTNPVMHSSDGVSLRDYIDLRFAEFQRAVDKAEGTMGSRLSGMNEFRDTLRDQAAKFVTREELHLMLRPVLDELKALRKVADIAEGKASQKSVLVAYVLSGISLLVAAIGIVLKIVQ